MRQLLTLLLCLFLLVTPAKAETPYVAVYCDPSLYDQWNGYTHQLDYRFKAKSLKDFEGFLKEVKTRAGNRKIILDICIHGTAWNKYLAFFVLNNELFTERQLLYRIDSILDSKQIEAVVEETCFGGNVYHNTVLGYSPSYPVYGMENFSNLTTLALESYEHQNFLFLKDLRVYKDVIPGDPIFPPTKKKNSPPVNPIYTKISILNGIFFLQDHPININIR